MDGIARRPEAGREVEVCLTEEELLWLVELLRWRAGVVVWPPAAEMTSRLLVVLDQRLREAVADAA